MDGAHVLISAPPTPRPFDDAEVDRLLARASGCVVFGRGARRGADIVADAGVVRVPLPDEAAASRLGAAARRHGVPLTPSLGRLVSRAFGHALPDVLDAPSLNDESRS